MCAELEPSGAGPTGSLRAREETQHDGTVLRHFANRHCPEGNHG